MFWLLIDRGLTASDDLGTIEVPVSAPPMGQILTRLNAQIADSFALAELEAALARKRVTAVEVELRKIVEELYDRTYATRRFATALEPAGAWVPTAGGVAF